MQNTPTPPEFNQLDRNIQKALSAFYTHARKKDSYVQSLKDDDGLSASEAEAAWVKELDALRAALDAAYSKLKDHVWPRGV